MNVLEHFELEKKKKLLRKIPGTESAESLRGVLITKPRLYYYCARERRAAGPPCP